MPANIKAMSGDRGEGKGEALEEKDYPAEGYLEGYVPNQVDHRMQAVYVDWFHANGSSQLIGVIGGDRQCQACWRNLMVLTSLRYNAPGGNVGRRFDFALPVELYGLREGYWNS